MLEGTASIVTAAPPFSVIASRQGIALANETPVITTCYVDCRTGARFGMPLISTGYTGLTVVTLHQI